MVNCYLIVYLIPIDNVKYDCEWKQWEYSSYNGNTVEERGVKINVRILNFFQKQFYIIKMIEMIDMNQRIGDKENVLW